MERRLDIYDEEVLERIEKEYKIRRERAYRKSVKDTKELVDTIDSYRSHSYEEICAQIVSIGKERYLTMDDETAYEAALYEFYMTSNEKNVAFSRLTDDEKVIKANRYIEDVMKHSTEQDVKNAADVYRRKSFEKYVTTEKENAYVYHTLFNILEAEEAKDYMALYQEYRYGEELLKARIYSIKKVAHEEGVALPLCLEDSQSIKAVKKEVRRVVKTEEITDEEKPFFERAKAAGNYGMRVLKENANLALKIASMSVLLGTGAYMGVYSITKDTNAAMGAMAATIPITGVASSLLFRYIGMKDDADSIAEAKQIGLFDAYTKSKKKKDEFLKYDQFLKDKYNKIEVEGENKNGLR